MMKTLNINLIAAAALALAVVPAFAASQPNPTANRGHIASSHEALSVHDRTPHVQVHSPAARP